MFSKLFPYILAAALAVFAYMGVELLSANTSNKLLASEVTSLQAEKEAKQAEVKLLANAVDVADRALSQMEKDRQLIIELHQEQAANNQLVADGLAKGQAEVNQLRQSTDEYIKTWAANHMPGSAVRLYQYAEYTGSYPDGGAEDTSIPDSTSKPAIRLFASNQF